MVKTSLYIDDELYYDIKLYCLKNKISMKKFFETIAKEKLK